MKDAMPERRLFLAAYDVGDSRRLAKTLHAVRRYATGGQLSVHECFLTEAERRALVTCVARILDPDRDLFFLLRLDPRSAVRTLGIAEPPEDPPFFYQE